MIYKSLNCWFNLKPKMVQFWFFLNRNKSIAITKAKIHVVEIHVRKTYLYVAIKKRTKGRKDKRDLTFVLSQRSQPKRK